MRVSHLLCGIISTKASSTIHSLHFQADGTRDLDCVGSDHVQSYTLFIFASGMSSTFEEKLLCTCVCVCVCGCECVCGVDVCVSECVCEFDKVILHMD